ncbi:MAG: hypothetical protein PHE55_16035 [Methylococcaceae bacterium]|nr:hypothetical protein [Methylococcaceae bacterium]
MDAPTAKVTLWLIPLTDKSPILLPGGTLTVLPSPETSRLNG